MKVEWLWKPLDSFIMFGLDRAHRSNAFLSFWTFWPIEASHKFIVTICEQKTNDCALLGSFQHKLLQRCFQLWCLPTFIYDRMDRKICIKPAKSCLRSVLVKCLRTRPNTVFIYKNNKNINTFFLLITAVLPFFHFYLLILIQES